MYMDNVGDDVRKSDTDNPHSGHRGRMFDRFLAYGADSLADHELLEIYLYFCIQRRNTNEIAHKMIERFGSLDGVFNASVEELSTVEYISKRGAVLIKLMKEMARRCKMEHARDEYCFDTMDKLGRFLTSLFYGRSEEQLYMLLFDVKMRIIDCHMLSAGGVNSVGSCLRAVVEKTVQSKAANVVLAHNHPSGLLLPSREDIVMTREAESVLRCIDVKLVAHIIVSGDRYAPIEQGSGGIL